MDEHHPRHDELPILRWIKSSFCCSADCVEVPLGARLTRILVRQANEAARVRMFSARPGAGSRFLTQRLVLALRSLDLVYA